MVKRRIIKIDSEKCNGCGICARACHEGAIGMIDGKAVLLRDDYCDGLGDCLPACPVSAISFEEREALEYDEEAVKKHMAERKLAENTCACAGSQSKTIEREETNVNSAPVQSCLSQWPVQIKLVPVNAPYFDNCNLLIAADCTAFAYGDFHNKFIKNRITLIGCPKLDMTDYSEKLSEILRLNNINTITVTRMQVPCCGGIENAVKNAVIKSGKNIPVEVVTITPDGNIL